MERQITFEHDGTTLYGQVMRVESTRLGFESHGVFTAYLDLKNDGGLGVSVGGYAYGENGFGLDQMKWIMRTVGVDHWEDLTGERVIALFTGKNGWGDLCVGIAHIDAENEVLILEDHATAWREKAGA